MSKITIFLVGVLIGGFLISCGNDSKTADKTNKNVSEQNAVVDDISGQEPTNETVSNQTVADDASVNQTATIEKAEIREEPKSGVYTTLSNGETRMVAETVKFDKNNFTEVKTYRKVTVSPNKRFAAIDANGFEESFVQIYDAGTGKLYKRTYGQTSGWTDNNLMKIQICNLASEKCSGKISVSSDKPWIFKQDERGTVIEGAKVLPTNDFISNIKKINSLSIFADLLEAAVVADAIKGTGPFTVFAPTNEAFERLPNGTVAKLLRPKNKKELVEIINKHIVAGEYNTVEIKDKMTLKTIGNDALTVSSNENAIVKINGSSTITQPDIYSSNGIIQIITEVLSK